MIEEALIDFEDDLEMAWEYFVEEGDAPTLEGFWEEGVVGVGEGSGDEAPGFFPSHAVNIVKETHQFDDGDGGVGIVELDDDLFGEILPTFVIFAEATKDVAERASDEKVLLNEAEFFA